MKGDAAKFLPIQEGERVASRKESGKIVPSL